MDPSDFRDSPLSRSIDRLSALPTGRRFLIMTPIVLGAVVLLTVLASLPNRVGWAGHALLGAGIAIAYLWGYRSERWFSRGIALNGVVTLIAFVQYGDQFDAGDFPVIFFFVFMLGWGLGFAAMAWLGSKVPTNTARRQVEVMGMVWTVLLLAIGGSVYFLASNRIAARESSLELRAEVTTPRAAGDLDRCLMETRVRFRGGDRNFHFRPDRENPDRRTYFNGIRNQRWTILDRGDLRVVQIETLPGAKLPDDEIAEAKRCATLETN